MLGAVQIHIRLIQDGLLPATVSARTIQCFIKANSLKSSAASGLLKDRKAFEEPFFGAMWQADTCYFPYIPDGSGKRNRTYLIAIVDDHLWKAFHKASYGKSMTMEGRFVFKLK